MIERPVQRRRGLAARIGEEGGQGLVELLIALLVLNIGIFATVAAFTSGMLSIRRASYVSTAAALADKNMEAFRNTAYGNIAAFGPANQTGADGRTYAVTATVSTGSQKTGVVYPGSGSVKVVTITVSDAATGTVLVTTSSTFSACSQSGLGGVSSTTACQS